MLGLNPNRPRARAGENADEERDKNPYDVVVELSGIIYIFNPPDMSKLAGAEPAAAESAEGETPVTSDAAQPGATPSDAAGGDDSADEAPAARKTTPAAEAGPGEDGDEPAASGAKNSRAAEKPAEDDSMDEKSPDSEEAKP